MGYCKAALADRYEPLHGYELVVTTWHRFEPRIIVSYLEMIRKWVIDNLRRLTSFVVGLFLKSLKKRPHAI